MGQQQRQAAETATSSWDVSLTAVLEVQDKVLWLPCVATGVMKTNISAKMMTLVSHKRREGHAELDRAETNVNVYGRDYAREPRRSTQAAPGERCLNEPRTALRKHKLGDWNFQVLQTPS